MSYDYTPNKFGFQVLTPDGFKDFAGISHVGYRPVLEVRFGNGRKLTATGNHRLFTSYGQTVRVDRCKVGDWVLTGTGKRRTKITAIVHTGVTKLVYDLVEVVDGHRYITNGVLSHNCEFVSDDETLINPLTLATLRSNEPIYYTNTVRWYREPEPNKSFLVGLDPSLGTGGDYAAIQVFQLPEMVQVAEWQHNETAPRGQITVLLQTLAYLDGVLRENDDQRGDPEIYWTIENNSIGEALLQIIEDTGEERFPGHFISERTRGRGRARKGMTTTNRSKLNACARFKSLMESARLTLSSKNAIKELKNFVATETSFKAKAGEHDDLVSAILLVVRMLDAAVAFGADVSALREVIGEDELIEEGMPVIV